MTRLTKMCRTPAKPLRNTATVATLKVNEFAAMSFAAFLTILDACSRAARTHEVFGLEALLFLLSADAIFFTAEVGVLAFKTLVVG